MSLPEEKIKKTFNEIKLPPSVRKGTTAMIDEKYASLQASESKLTKSKVWKISSALAAIVMLFAIGLGGFRVYAAETAVVGIEINPAIELGINQFGSVVAVRAANDDGQKLINKIAITSMNYKDALDTLMNHEAFLSLIDADSFVEISVICDNEAQARELVDRGQQSINTLPCAGQSSSVSSQLKNEADSYGMGVGRYSVARELIKLDSSLTIEDCMSMSMRELRERIAQINPNSEFAWNGNGQGKGRQNRLHAQ